MADALSDLSEMVARIRREAHAEGYAKAMAEIANWAGDRILEVDLPSSRPSDRNTLSNGESIKPKPSPATTVRAPKGENRRRVEEALRAAEKRPISIKELQKAVEAKYDIDMNYSSVQQALAQLRDELVAEPTGERGMWDLTSIAKELADL